MAAAGTCAGSDLQHIFRGDVTGFSPVGRKVHACTFARLANDTFLLTGLTPVTATLSVAVVLCLSPHMDAIMGQCRSLVSSILERMVGLS